MKKFIISIVMALAAVAAGAQQTGDMAVGLNLGFAPCLESGSDVTNFVFGAKFQYNITDPVRLEADLNYNFKSKGIDVFEITANGHYLVGINDMFTIYPLAGIGYGRVGGSYKAMNRFIFNIGVGGQYAVNESLAVNMELKYQYMKDFGRFPIMFGLIYRF